MIKKTFLLVLAVFPLLLKCQDTASSVLSNNVTDTIAETTRIDLVQPFVPAHKIYLEKNGDSFFCLKPKIFSFATHIPGDFAG